MFARYVRRNEGKSQLEGRAGHPRLQHPVHVVELHDDHPVPAALSLVGARRGAGACESLVGRRVLGVIRRVGGHGADLGTHGGYARQAAHGDARELPPRRELFFRRHRADAGRARRHADVPGLRLGALADGSRHHDALCAAKEARPLPRHHAGRHDGGRRGRPLVRRCARDGVRHADVVLPRGGRALSEFPDVRLPHQGAASVCAGDGGAETAGREW